MKGNAVTLTAQRMTRYKDVPVDDNFLDLIYEPREVRVLFPLHFSIDFRDNGTEINQNEGREIISDWERVEIQLYSSYYDLHI